MKIAIVGAGKVGSALAQKWAFNGHEIYLGLREPSDPKNQIWDKKRRIFKHTVSEAVGMAEVVLIALPIPQVVETIKGLGDLSAKVVIDATNAVFAKPQPYQHTVEALLKINNTLAVKCFNSTGYENMIDTRYGDYAADMFMAGDDAKSKEVVSQLAKDAGFEACYDFGGADKVPLLEQFALAWINLAMMQKQGRDFAFKILNR